MQDEQLDFFNRNYTSLRSTLLDVFPDVCGAIPDTCSIAKWHEQTLPLRVSIENKDENIWAEESTLPTVLQNLAIHKIWHLLSRTSQEHIWAYVFNLCDGAQAYVTHDPEEEETEETEETIEAPTDVKEEGRNIRPPMDMRPPQLPGGGFPPQMASVMQNLMGGLQRQQAEGKGGVDSLDLDALQKQVMGGMTEEQMLETAQYSIQMLKTAGPAMMQAFAQFESHSKQK